jgi:hypothetical protein
MYRLPPHATSPFVYAPYGPRDQLYIGQPLNDEGIPHQIKLGGLGQLIINNFRMVGGYPGYFIALVLVAPSLTKSYVFRKPKARFPSPVTCGPT